MHAIFFIFKIVYKLKAKLWIKRSAFIAFLFFKYKFSFLLSNGGSTVPRLIGLLIITSMIFSYLFDSHEKRNFEHVMNDLNEEETRGLAMRKK